MRNLTLAAAILATATFAQAEVATAEEVFIPPIVEATPTVTS